MKGNPESINKGKEFKQMGNLMFIPEIKILLHNAGAKCTRSGKTD
jgi:hypothetical protein